jgi:hypothetical protein
MVEASSLFGAKVYYRSNMASYNYAPTVSFSIYVKLFAAQKKTLNIISQGAALG